MTAGKRIVFLLPLGFAVVLMALFLLAVFNQWFGPPQGVGDVFCESHPDRIIKQPSNTWSNLGFIAAGLLIAWQMSREKHSNKNNPFTRRIFTPIFFACLTIFLGPGSMAMHATLTPIGGALDMLSMYLIAAFVCSYAMQRFYGLSSAKFTLLFVAIVLTCECIGFSRYQVPLVEYSGNAAFAFFIITGIVFEALNTYVRKFEIEKIWGLLSLLSIITAFTIWNFWKNDSPLCDPTSIFQGHAAWHLLDALAVYFLFRFYVSEHEPGTELSEDLFDRDELSVA